MALIPAIIKDVAAVDIPPIIRSAVIIKGDSANSVPKSFKD